MYWLGTLPLVPSGWRFRFFNRSVREGGFIECDLRGNSDFVILRIPEVISLGTGFMTDKGHWESLWIEFLALFVVDPSATTECTEVHYVRDLSGESFVWSSPVKALSRSAVHDVDNNCQCFSPEAVLHARVMKNGTNARPDSLLHPFC